jgi:excisionase family DNA binding protein
MEDRIIQELQEIQRLLSLNKAMLSINDFCLYTGISKSYAYHLTSMGKIKFYKPCGKMIFFEIEDVINFLKQNPVEASNGINIKASTYLFRSKY